MGFRDEFKKDFDRRQSERTERQAERGAAGVGIRTAYEAKVSGVDKYLTEPKVPMPTWEYAVISFLDKWADLNEVRRQINAMGAHGWEMCERRDSGTGAMRSQDDSWFTLIFKRRTS